MLMRLGCSSCCLEEIPACKGNPSHRPAASVMSVTPVLFVEVSLIVESVISGLELLVNVECLKTDVSV